MMGEMGRKFCVEASKRKRKKNTYGGREGKKGPNESM